MAVLVTRPEPDNVTTAEALRRRGFDVLLAPLLRLQPLQIRYDENLAFGGAIFSSANALRAISGHALIELLRELPVFAVGERTAQAARASGFTSVVTADGDVPALRKLIIATVGKAARRKPLLYLCGADVSGDIVAALEQSAITVHASTVYRMLAVEHLPANVGAAFAAQGVEAVLHYSSRSAQSFVAAVRAEALEIAGLATLQICISEAVARVLREAGATRVVPAEKPQEDAMIDALERPSHR